MQCEHAIQSWALLPFSRSTTQTTVLRNGYCKSSRPVHASVNLAAKGLTLSSSPENHHRSLGAVRCRRAAAPQGPLRSHVQLRSKFSSAVCSPIDLEFPVALITGFSRRIGSPGWPERHVRGSKGTISVYSLVAVRHHSYHE